MGRGISAHSSGLQPVTGEVRPEGLEAAAHVASSVRKQRDEGSLLFGSFSPFIQSETIAREWRRPQGVGLPISTDRVKITRYRQAQRPASQAVLGSAELTAPSWASARF